MRSTAALLVLASTCGTCDGSGGGSSTSTGSSSGDFSCADYGLMLDVEVELARECSTDAECGQVMDGTGCGCETDDLVASTSFDLAYFYDLWEEAVSAGCTVDFATACDCPTSTGFACRAGSCTWE